MQRNPEETQELRSIHLNKLNAISQLMFRPTWLECLFLFIANFNALVPICNEIIVACSLIYSLTQLTTLLLCKQFPHQGLGMCLSYEERYKDLVLHSPYCQVPFISVSQKRHLPYPGDDLQCIVHSGSDIWCFILHLISGRGSHTKKYMKTLQKSTHNRSHSSLLLIASQIITSITLHEYISLKQFCTNC